MDRIIASMATMQSRKSQLRRTIVSILPQVDELQIYLNNFGSIPGFLKRPKIKVFQSQNEAGDLGDAGKFYKSSINKGYCLIIDDDIIYPLDFANNLINKIEHYKRKCLVGLHGVIMNNVVGSYYRDRTVFHCRLGLEKDKLVHIIATSSMMYHSDTIKIKIEDFPHPNMADIWLGMLAQEQKIGVVAIKRKDNYIRILPVKDDIYSKYRNRDSFQTKIINTLKWQINGT